MLNLKNTKMELMFSEYERIQLSILNIDSFNQVAPTFKWINLFEKRFKDVSLANSLKEMLKDIEL